MTELIEALSHFDTALNQTAPAIAARLQPGLSRVEIKEQISSFSWELPSDAYDLYQWHNGLSGKPGRLNLAEKLLRLRGKWHGELSGRENEIYLRLSNSPSKTFRERLIIAKFLPLDYALSGHRHLKLGKCFIDLLPFAIVNNGSNTIYCMMRLDAENPIIYYANGTKLPPMRVTESFLSAQPQFSRLSQVIAVLTRYCQQGIQPNTPQERLVDGIDAELDLRQFDQIYQQRKS